MQRKVIINDPNNPRAIPASSDTAPTLSAGVQAEPGILAKIQDILFLCLKNWYWYVLSLSICLGAAYYEIKKTPNQYSRTASIMIKGDERSLGNSSALQGLGVDAAPQNVSNEIMAIKSVDLMSQVAHRLNLDMEYFEEGTFHNKVVYGRELPVELMLLDAKESDDMSCVLEVLPDSTVRLSEVVYCGKPIGKSLRLPMGERRSTPIGEIEVTRGPAFEPGVPYRLLVQKHTMGSTIGTVNSRCYAYLRSREATIIDIGYTDYSPQRAEDILNAIVQIYNESWITDRNQVAQSANAFINERILSLENEINFVEHNIADYMADNVTLNIEAAGSAAYEKVYSSDQQISDIETQLYMVQYIVDYVNGNADNSKLLPVNTGLNNPNIDTQMSEYNSILLQRNGHLAHSSEQNPLVIDLNEKLDIQRMSIMHSLENELVRLNSAKSSALNIKESSQQTVKETPQKSFYLKSIERQKAAKEELYMFLLKKREENELSQAFTAYNTRLIEPPHGSNVPVAPTPDRTYLMALLFALAVPTGCIVIKECFNTVVRGRKDLERLSLPFVGEIPLDKAAAKANKALEKAKSRKGKMKGDKSIESAVPEFVVKEKNRNVMNEAFRVVRSNLEFILGYAASHNVIMVTSLNPSSGKTFVSANLAYSLALNNKRVIVVDLDMRKGNLSKYCGKPSYGLSNYLYGQFDDYKSLIVRKDNLDMLPCGPLPPNPSELLYTEAFKTMIEQLKKDYDYVFLDCPPVEVVADAQIINRYADLTIFVARAQLLDRAFLPDLEKWYQDKKYRNLVLLLNGTTDAFSRYGYHKYGYRYGYHYGNYGYGY